MALENGTYIPDLVAANPDDRDALRDAAGHLKLIKGVLRNSLPNIGGPVNATHTELNRLVGVLGDVLSTGTPRPGQLKLLANVTPAAAATLDLINGVGGVVIDTNYDEYTLDLNGLSPASTAQLRLELSSNGGSTWGVMVGTDSSSYQTIVSGTGSSGASSAASFPVTGTLQVGGSAADSARLSARVNIKQVIDSNTRILILSESVHGNGSQVAWTSARPASTSAFNAMRLSWSTGNFLALGAVRLWGRRFT